MLNLLAALRSDAQWMANVMAWRQLPARAPQYAAIPSQLHPLVVAALRQRGIDQLYSHQAQAVEHALAGEHVAVVTPTASGKTLCYTLPVLHTLLGDSTACALYLFPTKALAQDQLDDLQSWNHTLTSITHSLHSPLSNLRSLFPISTYDGDTPQAERSRIRKNVRLLITNPDMLHVGILPYHTAWAEFFAGLRYVVIDEMHTYRGVFGSQVANVLRRLGRIAAHYGRQPRFICASATIANPGQLAEQLIEQPVRLVDKNGAPSGEKHIVLYNPPLYDAERGLRRSSVLEAQALAQRAIQQGVQTILFARSRLTTELLLSYLREGVGRLIPTGETHSTLPLTIRGYRGGYLPAERRAIEASLRSGEAAAVVATNALELGIDIGQLQAAILCGYPGSIASTWQQIGRAARTLDAGLAVLVATGEALDQYVIQHPEFIFERSPEYALINPDNLMLLVEQMRCALFELPFGAGEQLGASPITADVLQWLVEQGEVQKQGERFFWSGAGFPAQRVNLRTSSSDAVLIQATDIQANEPRPRIIGQIDQASASLLVHESAIYLHEGQSYRVKQLDLVNRLAQVTPVEVDYYTEVAGETTIELLTEHEQRIAGGGRVAHGELQVSSQVVGFRRIKRFTHENLGVQLLDYPPQVTETTGYWLSVLPATQAQLEQAGLWYDSLNDYGPNWQEQRERVRQRDRYRCVRCGAPEAPDRQHDVHHLAPFRIFGYVAGLNEHYLEANRLENLMLVCRTCHRRLEATVRIHSGLDGLAYALNQLAPLHLMCAPQDIGVSVERSGTSGRVGEGGREKGVAGLSTVYLYERVAAGLGFSARLYEIHDELLAAAQELIAHCACHHGCPACVGPVLETQTIQLPTKQLTLALLGGLMGKPLVHESAGLASDVEF
jgi:DEAD/DEAH box helicase domain-containing protein